MKKTQFIELFNTIKDSIVSFISITLFVSLSVAVYVGISGTAIAYKESMENTMDITNFHDIDVIFPYGISNSDLEKIKNVDGVDEVELTYTGYSYLEINGNKYQAKLLTLNDNIDKYLNCIGDLPTKENEIGIDYTFASRNKINIGDTIKFINDNDGSTRSLVKLMNFDIDNDEFDELLLEDNNKMSYLKTDTFKVTAIMRSPEFTCSSAVTYGVATTNKYQIDCFAYFNKSAFDEKAFLDYPELLITSNNLSSYSTFSDEYKIESDALIEKINNEAIYKIVNDKNNKIFDKISAIETAAQNKLDDAQKQIIEAEKQIKNAEITLKEYKNKIKEAQEKLQEAENQFNYAQKEFNNKKILLSEVKTIYFDVKEKILLGFDYIVANKELIIEKLQQVESYASTNGYENVVSTIEHAIDLIENDKIEEFQQWCNDEFVIVENFIVEAEQTIKSAESQLNDAKNQIDTNKTNLEKAQVEINNKEKELNNAKTELENAKQEYDNKCTLFLEFKDEASQVSPLNSSSIARTYNPAFIVGNMMCDILNKLRYSMATLFVVVGLLVCYSTISRIVHDQTIRIGTKKALGLNKKEITSSFMLYVTISLIIGCIIGNLVGYYIVEKVLITAVSTNNYFAFIYTYAFKDGLLVSILEFVLLLSTTYIACKETLNAKVTDLLVGATVTSSKIRFYEKTKLWNKLSLFTKTVINNFFNDKKRVFGTIVGIARSTALLVTAFTLQDNIMNSFNVQFNNYYHFDSIITYEGSDQNAKKEIIKILDEYEINRASLYYSRAYVETPSNRYIASCLFVPEDKNEFANMVTISPSIAYIDDTSKGYWMSNSYNKYFKTTKDDPLTLMTFDGKKSSILPSGYFNFYLTDYTNILDIQTYEDNYDIEYQTNAFLINTKNKDISILKEKLNKIDGYRTYTNYYELSQGTFLLFQSVSKSMVAVYAVLAVAMSLLVLLSLLTMFVNEKKFELIVLMINGFTIKQAKRYIYSDTIFLTIISIILGCILGSFVGNLSVSSFESEATSFIHSIDIKACLIGSTSSVALTFIITLIALKQINKFKLSDINKARV